MVNIENCHFRLKGTGRFGYAQQVHSLCFLGKQLGQGCKECRLEYFQLLAVCAAGRAGRGEQLEQQTPPKPGHTCPAPGLTDQQVFCWNSGCGCQKRQSLIMNKKTPLCGTGDHSCGYQLLQLAPQEARHCRKHHFSLDFLFFFIHNQQYLWSLNKHQHPSPH